VHRNPHQRRTCAVRMIGAVRQVTADNTVKVVTCAHGHVFDIAVAFAMPLSGNGGKPATVTRGSAAESGVTLRAVGRAERAHRGRTHGGDDQRSGLRSGWPADRVQRGGQRCLRPIRGHWSVSTNSARAARARVSCGRQHAVFPRPNQDRPRSLCTVDRAEPHACPWTMHRRMPGAAGSRTAAEAALHRTRRCR
jgi:hypothetical protein